MSEFFSWRLHLSLREIDIDAVLLEETRYARMPLPLENARCKIIECGASVVGEEESALHAEEWLGVLSRAYAPVVFHLCPRFSTHEQPLENLCVPESCLERDSIRCHGVYCPDVLILFVRHIGSWSRVELQTSSMITLQERKKIEHALGIDGALEEVILLHIEDRGKGVRCERCSHIARPTAIRREGDGRDARVGIDGASGDKEDREWAVIPVAEEKLEEWPPGITIGVARRDEECAVCCGRLHGD